MATIEELKTKYKEKAAETTTDDSPKRKDRGIKGTMIDDYVIEALIKLLALVAILILGSIGYLFLEKVIGKGILTPIRIWLPVVGWIIIAFLKKPFLRFGWWGALCTLIIIPTTSGYLWQFFQSIVGNR
jgi:hypothetical protein